MLRRTTLFLGHRCSLAVVVDLPLRRRPRRLLPARPLRCVASCLSFVESSSLIRASRHHLLLPPRNRLQRPRQAPPLLPLLVRYVYPFGPVRQLGSDACPTGNRPRPHHQLPRYVSTLFERTMQFLRDTVQSSSSSSTTSTGGTAAHYAQCGGERK